MEDISSQGETTYEVKVEEAKCFMRLKLPEYVLDCLVFAGSDTLALISDMDKKSLKEEEELCARVQGHSVYYLLVQ